ncbi:glycosyltransferase family 4 protein [Desulfonatronum thioautotrophicum]|uniref:glycosyltransferase family 4 protein n=1 Tax=Desulfonatronum thioautotrophicum TaxID=617001 RepID=UPI0005EB366C|nr:glycosyltransferase family 4 protein [Desulfonatronum thioautotrophicum]
MNVLHIVGGKLTGGAARGAYWLHHGLKEIGVDSWILTNSRQTLGDDTVVSTSRTKMGRLLNKINLHIEALLLAPYAKRQRITFSTGLTGFDFTKTEVYHRAQVIHLHWINEGFINIRHLSKVNKPIIWTMRDMWSFTGGCHYTLSCEQYLSGCGRCPHLGSKTSADLSRLVWKRKRKFLPQRMHIVGISQWLSDCAQSSLLFQNFKIRTIQNNINIRDFFPIEKQMARRVLGLPLDRPVVLAGAQRLDDDFKGFPTFLKALGHLKGRPFLLFFGNLDRVSLNCLEHDHRHLGFLTEPVLLRLAYSAADVFVSSSHMEAFGKTLAEAMACGTPAVCFDATGPRDIVDHQVNGFRARPFFPEELAAGIDWVLDHSTPAVLARNAREKAERHFDSKVVSEIYSEIYNEVFLS